MMSNMTLLKKSSLFMLVLFLGLGSFTFTLTPEGISIPRASAAGTPGDYCSPGDTRVGKWDAAGTNCVGPYNAERTKCALNGVVGSFNSTSVCVTPNAAGVYQTNQVVNGGVNRNDGLTCENLSADKIDGQDVTPFISGEGFIKQLCSGNNIAGRSAIEIVIENFSNYLVFLTVGICMIMIVLGIIQAGTSGPGGIGAAKSRIIAAVTSIALLWAGRLYLSLSGITGGEFLGVNIKDGFTQDTIPLIADAILKYLTYTGGALSVIFIIFGGIRMMTSTGNPQGIAQAKKIITYAIISLVAIVGVGLIFQLIQLVLTGTTNNP